MKNNKRINEYIYKVIDIVIIKSWWVLLFLFVCYVGNDVGVQKCTKIINELQCKKDNLLNEKQIAAKKVDDLKSRIESQSDPSWVERVLIKELGVVPENQVKVYFSK
jgi:hypothetical protein